MENSRKTLLDSLLSEDSGGTGQSLEELLGMAESKTEHEQSLMIKAAERGDQDAIWLVGINFLYGKNGFSQDPLEGIFWLSQSTRDTAPIAIADYYEKQGDFENMKKWYLKVAEQGKYRVHDVFLKYLQEYWGEENRNLDYAEQCLEVLFELDDNEVSKEALYAMAMGLGMKFAQENQVKKGLKWLKCSAGHTNNADLVVVLLERLYAKILTSSEFYEEYVQEAVTYLEQLAEKGDDKAIRLLSQYYKNHPEDVKKTIYWVEKSSKTGSSAAQYWLAEAYLGKRDWGLGVDLEKGEQYLKLVEKNPESRIGTLQGAKRLREYLETERDKRYNVPKKVLKSKDAETLLKEAEKTKSTVLRIPNEYTDIDKKAFSYAAQPYIKHITEIILPETVCTIGEGAFDGCCSLTRVNLPKRLESLGKWAFKGSTFKGIFMKTVKSNNVIENLTIPGKTKLEQNSLGDISGIGCLRFEEGRTEMDWMVFYGLYQETRICEMHLPSSMMKLTNTDTHTNGLYIEKLYAPKHLKPAISIIEKGKQHTEIGTIVYL